VEALASLEGGSCLCFWWLVEMAVAVSATVLHFVNVSSDICV